SNKTLSKAFLSFINCSNCFISSSISETLALFEMSLYLLYVDQKLSLFSLNTSINFVSFYYTLTYFVFNLNLSQPLPPLGLLIIHYYFIKGMYIILAGK